MLSAPLSTYCRVLPYLQVLKRKANANYNALFYDATTGTVRVKLPFYGAPIRGRRASRPAHGGRRPCLCRAHASPPLNGAPPPSRQAT